MTGEELQTRIAALASADTKQQSEWIAKVQAESNEVIAGAILSWITHGGISMVAGDPMASRREAAQAILDSRLAKQVTDATTKLNDSIDSYQADSKRQTNVMLGLTVVIAVLTVVMAWETWPRPKDDAPASSATATMPSRKP